MRYKCKQNILNNCLEEIQRHQVQTPSPGMPFENSTGFFFIDTHNETNCDKTAYFDYFFYASATNTVLSFIGNLLVVLIIYRNKSLQTVPNYFVASMSVSDLLFQMSFMLAISDRLKLFSDIIAGILKRLTEFIITCSFVVSMQSFMAICVHRFYAVVYPLKARLERHKLCALVIFLNWLAAIAVAALEAFMHHITQRKVLVSCSANIHAKEILHMFKVVLGFVTFIIITVLYSIVIVHLRRQKIPGNSFSLQEMLRRKQNMRLTILFLVIIVVFFFTWNTFGTLFLLFRYFNHIDCCTGLKVTMLAQILTGVHTAMNPTIYFACCRNYRQGLKVAFSCCTKLLPRGIKLSIDKVNNIELKQ